MRRLPSRKERQLAKRLHLSDLITARRRGFWSDGNRIYTRDEIEKRIKKLSDSLINDTGNKRPKPGRSANAYVSLGMIRKNPRIHDLPDAIPEMLSVRAGKLRSDALNGVPGAMEHFLVARRLARKLGSLDRYEALLPEEERALEERFQKPCAVITAKPVSMYMGLAGDVRIPAGTRIYGSGSNEWFTPDGLKIRISPGMLVRSGSKPARLRASEKQALAALRDEAQPQADDCGYTPGF
jgi:hypothetical protein